MSERTLEKLLKAKKVEADEMYFRLTKPFKKGGSVNIADLPNEITKVLSDLGEEITKIENRLA